MGGQPIIVRKFPNALLVKVTRPFTQAGQKIDNRGSNGINFPLATIHSPSPYSYVVLELGAFSPGMGDEFSRFLR